MKKKTVAMHELQRLFAELAPKGLLEPGRFVKLLKTSAGLLDNKFTERDIEILFVKVRYAYLLFRPQCSHRSM